MTEYESVLRCQLSIASDQLEVEEFLDSLYKVGFVDVFVGVGMPG